METNSRINKLGDLYEKLLEDIDTYIIDIEKEKKEREVETF